MIDESILSVEETTDISINGRHFKWNRSLTDLLSTKNVSRGVVTTDDQKRYKTILQLTNANLQGYYPGVKCRHRADPNSGSLFQSSSPDAEASRR